MVCVKSWATSGLEQMRKAMSKQDSSHNEAKQNNSELGTKRLCKNLLQEACLIGCVSAQKQRAQSPRVMHYTSTKFQQILLMLRS
jgi:hypothetical protein